MSHFAGINLYRDLLPLIRLEERRNCHKPTDPAQIASELRRLRDAGLALADLASVTGLHPAAVLAVLGEPVSHSPPILQPSE